MFTRKDALAAKEGMEQYRSPDMTLRVCKLYLIESIKQTDRQIIDSVGCRFWSPRLQ